MLFGVPKESSDEARVALTPESIKLLAKKGHKILVEKGAGEAAFISDAEFTAAGAELASDAAAVFAKADCVLKVQPLSDREIGMLAEGKATISLVYALRNPELVEKLVKKKLTSFSMDAMPRITRAQSMDVLSSQATVAGYKAVLLAAEKLPKFFPMLTTAAGTIRPAQGFILGAGVAGLQAIATARRLGAVVEAFDMRPAVKEQVQSLGATFIEVAGAQEAGDKYGYAKQASPELIAKQQALVAERLKLADFVITTAQVPGKTAPRLITKAMVEGMKPGSIIVDLAGETGGNCELTKANEVVVHNHVTILAPTNLAAHGALDASRMYGRNVVAFINEIAPDASEGKGFTFDWNNEVFRETCVAHNGEKKK